jgi:hypothetical protein
MNMNMLIKNLFVSGQKRGVVSTLSLIFVLAGCFGSCMKKGDDTSQEDDTPQGIYYVVGFDGTYKVDEQNGRAMSAGYLLISEKNKCLLLENNLMDNILSGSLDDIVLCVNLIADIYANLIPDPFDGVIDFPEESMRMSDTDYCAWTFFPEEYRFAFKVQMKYRPMTEEEERFVPRCTNAMCYNPLIWIKFNCIVITSISKIQ